MTRRLLPRAFVASLAALATSAAIAFWPLSANGQQPASPRHIGVLLVVSPESRDVQMLRQGLRDMGYVEGRDVVIDWRSAHGDSARIPELAADLVRRKVDVIVVETTRATKVLKDATSTIPIVMTAVGDPVGSGLVTSLAHPGGNVTGLSLMTAQISGKRLQLFKDAIPRLTRVTVLWNPDNPWHANANADLEATAPALSLKLSFVRARTPEELGTAFSEITRTNTQGLYVMDDALFFSHRKELLSLASKARVPANYPDRPYADDGGLMSYGPNVGDIFRRSAGYVDKILKGAKPGDLPIEQPTEFELVVNLKTANAVGITIPQSLLLRADDVIR